MPKPDRIAMFALRALRVAIVVGAVLMVACIAALAWLWPNLWVAP